MCAPQVKIERTPRVYTIWCQDSVPMPIKILLRVPTSVLLHEPTSFVLHAKTCKVHMHVESLKIFDNDCNHICNNSNIHG
jgi:hypothetical protein